jgi:hypothetical protein
MNVLGRFTCQEPVMDAILQCDISNCVLSRWARRYYAENIALYTQNPEISGMRLGELENAVAGR